MGPPAPCGPSAPALRPAARQVHVYHAYASKGPSGYVARGYYSLHNLPVEGLCKIVLGLTGVVYHLAVAHGGWP